MRIKLIIVSLLFLFISYCTFGDNIQFILDKQEVNNLKHPINTKKVAIKSDFHPGAIKGSHVEGLVEIIELRTYSGGRKQIEDFYNKNGIRPLWYHGDMDREIFIAFVENMSYGKSPNNIWETIDNKSWNVPNIEKMNNLYVIIKRYGF